MLEIHHAEIPSCKDCRQWVYDKDWRPVLYLTPQGKRPQPRNGSPSPCWKCPKGPIPFEKEPTRTTLLTIDYFYECQADAAGLLPRDRRVIENNAVIARIKERSAQASLEALPMLAMLGTALKGKK